jgi:acyl transferase domain-containing protein/NAD(P)H-dependent flavin oxidoreductase YrpB (nitropropane dioxygenase family)/NADP-dependent 3-hydroxy acid dehydrogenase YdfG
VAVEADEVLGISPFETPDARLVAELCAAGALGVLDLGAGDRRARRALDQAVRWTAGPFGVRLGEHCAFPIEELPEAVELVVVPAGRAVPAGRRTLVEVTDLAEAGRAIAAGAAGLIARGNEAGGRVGELTTFVLLQQLLAELDVPVWACGGIGPHTAAAAMAGGAAGVVLDTQLALLPSASPSREVVAALSAMDGSETTVLDGRRVLRPRAGGPALPVGQDGYLAAELARRHGDVTGVVAAVRAAMADASAPEMADTLTENSVLAGRLGTRLPVVQGPMTRVSDQPELAASVAEAGGMPFLALALADADTTARMLSATAERLGGRPWGAGILGFAPEQTRAAQLAAIERAKPSAVIIAGGRPSQATALEAAGIATFLHVPSPRLLGQFLATGARRFVFEGAECGGHIGPRSSFCLWQAQLLTLLDFLDREPDAQVDVLFAGGVHDARSAAMVAALAAPLTARGVGVGVLMGTAYLFTREAVGSGAIGPVFQQQVRRAGGTAVLETAPGHLTRAVTSPFAAEFDAIRAELARRGLPEREIWEQLEQLNVGRLRIASKGLRRADGQLVEVDEATQLAEGLFMAGQVAALREEVGTVAQLHHSVTGGAAELLRRSTRPARPAPARVEAPPPLDVAIIGMAAVFPGAEDTAAFWANVLGNVDSVTEVPTDRWDPDVHYVDPAGAEKPDGERVVSRWGGFLPRIPFDPLRYGIPPAAMASIEPVHLIALEMARRALADAGYADRPFDRSRTAVVFGAESGGELSNAAMLRAMLPGYLAEVPAELAEQLPEFTEDTFPGVLANVLAGRIANRLDLGGANYTVDAACASSLAALDAACRELSGGTADLVLCGGADTHNGIYDYRLFGAVGALSPTGRSRPFDRSADGIAISEGVGVVVLKRLADAERDGDRVYAVIRGIGSASDGRSLGLTAPRPEGQHAALTRAYANARISPDRVELIEAHGTGTAVGDRTELASLTALLSEAGARPGGTVLGSVKSQIGHTKCAAGLAGLIKTALAVHTGVQPPTAHLTAPAGGWSADQSPFAFTTRPRPWARPPAERVAGLSGFGFGGTNFHAVLTGHPGPAPRHGAQQWPAELFAFASAEDVAWLRGLLDAHPRARLRDLALSCARRFDRAARPAVRAFVAADLARLRSALDADDVVAPATERPAVALLFPGQGSQQVDMAAGLFTAFPELQDLLQRGERWAELLYPGTAFDDASAAAQRDRLRDTRVAQPTLGIAGLATYHFLAGLGIEPDLLAGHSYGELVALCAGGAFDAEQLLALSAARAELILEAAGADPGTMAAVTADPVRVLRVIDAIPGVVVANQNSPSQMVLSGPSDAIAEATRQLAEAGITARPIPVACAFHSPVVAGAGAGFGALVDRMQPRAPELPVWSNRTAARYPTDPAAIGAELGAQLASPVRFAAQIEAMYADGARVFVECGPGTVLSGLVAATLGDLPHRTVHFERAGGGLTGALTAVAELALAGVRPRVTELFRGRDAVDLADAAPTTVTWTVDGQAVRTADGAYLPGAGAPARRVALAGSAPIGQPRQLDPDGLVNDYFQATREFVAAQRDIMLAYLGSDLAPRADAVGALRAPERQSVPDLAAESVAPAGNGDRSRTESPLAVITALISERTGYPIEMIEPDLDLERDLSIDSIKRTELAGELATRYGLDPAQIDQLTQVRTAAELAERLGGGPAAPSAAPRPEPSVIDAPAAVSPVGPPPAAVPVGVAPRRFVLTAEATAPVPAVTDPAGRTIAVSGVDNPVGAELAGLLGAAGATVVGPDQVERADLLVHLDAFSPAGPDDDDFVLPEAFPLLRAAALGTGGLLVAAPGPDRRATGLRGFVRAVAREFPDSMVRLVESEGPADATATRLLAELGRRGDEPVVTTGAQRTAPVLTERPLGSLAAAGGGPDGQGGAEAEAIGLRPDSVLLLLGGARGITARFAVTAAAASGCQVVLAGRTALDVDPEPAALAAARGPVEVRAALARLGHRDPAQLDREARRVLARREVVTTLDAVRAAGGRAEYHPVDVTDPQAVADLVKRVHTEHGRLDGVVFAAGVIEDRLLADKTVASFRRVFDTKVAGAQHLRHALRELGTQPGFVVLFGSIAGVLGNRGQSDYAAANDALDTIGRQWSADTRVLTVHWGPWAPDPEHGGMVTTELAADYARRGIGLIDPHEGALSLLRELAWGDQPSVVYTASGW